MYEVKTKKAPGTNYSEVYESVFGLYAIIRKKTKRRPYIRSAYFNKDKIFLGIFWSHLHEKLNHRDKTRRLKFFPCALELIQQSRLDPESKESVDKKSEILHRFAGKTKEGEIFFVQIKEEKRNGQKSLISVFPLEK